MSAVPDLLKTPKNWTEDFFKVPHHKTRQPIRIRFGYAAENKKPAARAFFLPGIDRPFETAYPIMRMLQEQGVSPVAMEWFGQGGSDHEIGPEETPIHCDAPFSWHADTLHAFVQKTGLFRNNAVNICVAHSRSGNIALQYMHRFQHTLDYHFDRTVLIAPAIKLASHVRLTQAPLIRSAIEKNHDKFRAMWIGNLIQDIREGLISGRVSKDSTAILDTLFEHHPELFVGDPSPRALDSLIKETAKTSDPAFLKAITAPTHIITPLREGLVCKFAQKEAADLMPNGTQELLPGVKHRAFYDGTKARVQVFHALMQQIKTVIEDRKGQRDVNIMPALAHSFPTPAQVYA